MEIKVPHWGAEAVSASGRGHTQLWYKQCLLTWLQIARSHYFSQSCLSGLNVRWLAIIKVGQCVWSEVHHRPNRSRSGLMQYYVCCGGGGKANQMANITELFSSRRLPEPGGVFMHLVSPSWHSLCFPCSPTGYDSTLKLGIPCPHPSPCLGTTGERAEINPELPDPTITPTAWGPAGQTLPPTQSKKVTTLLAPSCPPMAPVLWHILAWGGRGLMAALSPSAATGLPIPHGQGLCSPLLGHSPAQGSHETSWNRGKQGGNWRSRTPVPVRVCTPTLALVTFSGTGIVFHQRLEVST